MADCATRLTLARDALHALVTGESVVSLSVNGRSTQYAQANIDQLRKYVQSLEVECGTPDSSGRSAYRRGCVRFHG